MLLKNLSVKKKKFDVKGKLVNEKLDENYSKIEEVSWDRDNPQNPNQIFEKPVIKWIKEE